MDYHKVSVKKFSRGDQLDIPVEVIEVDLTKVHGRQYKVAVRGAPDQTAWVCGASLSASRLVKEAPRPIQTGDLVTWGSEMVKYKVLTTHQNWAVLVGEDEEDGCPFIQIIAGLRHAD